MVVCAPGAVSVGVKLGMLEGVAVGVVVGIERAVLEGDAVSVAVGVRLGVLEGVAVDVAVCVAGGRVGIVCPCAPLGSDHSLWPVTLVAAIANPRPRLSTICKIRLARPEPAHLDSSPPMPVLLSLSSIALPDWVLHRMWLSIRLYFTTELDECLAGIVRALWVQ